MRKCLCAKRGQESGKKHERGTEGEKKDVGRKGSSEMKGGQRQQEETYVCVYKHML